MIKHEKFKQFTVGTSGLGGYDLIENCCLVFFNVARKKTLGFKTKQQKMGVSESGASPNSNLKRKRHETASGIRHIPFLDKRRLGPSK